MAQRLICICSVEEFMYYLHYFIVKCLSASGFLISLNVSHIHAVNRC